MLLVQQVALTANVMTRQPFCEKDTNHILSVDKNGINFRKAFECTYFSCFFVWFKFCILLFLPLKCLKNFAFIVVMNFNSTTGWLLNVSVWNKEHIFAASLQVTLLFNNQLLFPTRLVQNDINVSAAYLLSAKSRSLWLFTCFSIMVFSLREINLF